MLTMHSSTVQCFKRDFLVIQSLKCRVKVEKKNHRKDALRFAIFLQRFMQFLQIAKAYAMVKVIRLRSLMNLLQIGVSFVGVGHPNPKI